MRQRLHLPDVHQDNCHCSEGNHGALPNEEMSTATQHRPPAGDVKVQLSMGQSATATCAKMPPIVLSPC